MDKRDLYPESPTDLQADVYRPSSLKRQSDDDESYLKPRKDITLSNISDFDLALLSLWDNIADACQDMGCPSASVMHEYQLHFWVNAKRSVGGFERREQGKQKQELSGSVDYKGKAPTQVIMPQ